MNISARIINVKKYEFNIACPLVIAFTLSLWNFQVSKNLTVSTVGYFLIFVCTCTIFGYGFFRMLKNFYQERTEFAAHFLVGFLIFNSSLFLMSLVTPLGVPFIVGLFFFVALIMVIAGGMRNGLVITFVGPVPSLIAVVVSAVAASIWCTDALRGQIVDQQSVIFPVWQDMFVHAREISVFSQSHGASTIGDIKLSGTSAPIYHFASYLAAAAAMAFTGGHAIDVYSSFQLPFGILLTGLASFALISSFWGAWPGVAAAAAVLLVPDSYQQGFGNRFLSYNFITQVNLGMLYGISCAAVAWIFVINGCRRGRLILVFIGYCFFAVCLFYKAHVFVANAFILMMYPIAFFPNIRTRIRFFLGLAALMLFVIVVTYSQTMSRIPVLRLDGSGISQYIQILLDNSDVGSLRNYFRRFFFQEQHSKALQGVVAVLMIAVSTFGIWLIAFLISVGFARKKIVPMIILFPLFVIANYVIMAVGLAIDTRGVGAPEELLNRPLSWAYLVIVSWTAGALYYVFLGDSAPSKFSGRVSAGVVLALGFLGIGYYSTNLQTYPTWRGYASFAQFNAAALCFVKAAEYIRTNSGVNDIVQDSENDPKFMMTAISERQLFVGETSFGGATNTYKKRLIDLSSWVQMSNPVAIRTFALENRIGWYLKHPLTPNSWPADIRKDGGFTCGEYGVYHFVP